MYKLIMLVHIMCRTCSIFYNDMAQNRDVVEVDNHLILSWVYVVPHSKSSWSAVHSNILSHSAILNAIRCSVW